MSKICKYLERYELYQTLVFKFLPFCFPEFHQNNMSREMTPKPNQKVVITEKNFKDHLEAIQEEETPGKPE